MEFVIVVILSILVFIGLNYLADRIEWKIFSKKSHYRCSVCKSIGCPAKKCIKKAMQNECFELEDE